MNSLIDKKKAKLAARRASLKKKMAPRQESSSEMNAAKIAELDEKWAADGLDDVAEAMPVRLVQHTLFGRQPKRREYIAGKRRQELSEIMPELPPVDVDYFIVAAGRGKRPGRNDIAQSFGFGNFIDYVADKFGDGCVLHMATWSMNRDHALMLLELLDSGRVGALNLVCDPAFTMRKNGLWRVLKSGMGRFDGCRYKLAKNHSKITCIRDADSGRFCTVTGSANLSGTPRAENYTVSTDPGLYHHFVNNFFEVIFLADRGGIW